jgi:ABC-2 type transport system ATP-binding protein
MNTQLRTIGRPDELRQTLFSRSLTVTTAAPLDRPDQVFTGLPGVQGWQPADANTPATPATRPGAGPAGYVVTVSDPAQAAPAVTRALVAAGADVLSIAESRHTLEDVYLELIEDTEGRAR